jgi:hypothetical protein
MSLARHPSAQDCRPLGQETGRGKDSILNAFFSLICCVALYPDISVAIPFRPAESHETPAEERIEAQVLCQLGKPFILDNPCA